jgi:hypothetical protein
MRTLILIILSFNGLCLYSQKLDSTLIDNNYQLNKYESDFLNVYFKTQKDTFDFSQKQIVFVSGSSGTRIISKKDYFHGLDLSDNKETNGQSLIIFTPEEKVQSGGYDAIILYWVKLFTDKRKQKIIKEIKISRE